MMMNKMTAAAEDDGGAACWHVVCTLYNMVYHATRRHRLHGGRRHATQERQEGRGARSRERKAASCSLPLHVKASAAQSVFAAAVGTK